MAESMPSATKNYFDVHYKILFFFGVPIEKLTIRFKKLYIFYAFMLHTFVHILFPILEVIYLIVQFDADTFSFIISYLMSHSLAVCKIFLLLVFRRDIDKLCKTVQTGRFLPDVQRSGHIENVYIRDAITTPTRISYFFYLFVLIIVGQRALYSMLNDGEDVDVYDSETNTNSTLHVGAKPFAIYLPFESNNSPIHEIICTYQILSNVSYGYVISAVDAIIYEFMSHIKAQYLILFRSLELFVERTERAMIQDGIEIDLREYKSPKRLPNGIEVVEKLPKKAQKYADMYIIDCVKHHQGILDLATGCETIFNWLLLLQFGGSSILICMQLYQLSLYDIISIQFFTMICYLTFGSVEILVFCWHGNEVKLVSEKLSDVVFQCNWQIVDAPTQKSVLLMLHRSGRPTLLTAGKFIFLSLDSFVSLIKGSVSYFMFLKQMNEEG